MILDRAKRNAPPTSRMIAIAERVDIDLSTHIKQSINGLLKELRKRRSEMWEEQKNYREGRSSWLQGKAMRRAEASGEKDWEKRLRQMNHNLTSRAANKKLTMVSKGSLKTFEKIQVPTHDWFYSAKSNGWKFPGTCVRWQGTVLQTSHLEGHAIRCSQGGSRSKRRGPIFDHSEIQPVPKHRRRKAV